MRHARTSDVAEIRALVDQNTGSRRLLEKHTVNLYEDILEFTVAEGAADHVVAGCGALHVMWEDLAELRTVAVDERRRGAGVGHLIVDELLDRARAVGVRRVFVLTFAVSFFASHGFREISGTPVLPEVYAELLRSYDDGVAEFLDLDRVKPNTLGNTRMLLRLLSRGNSLRGRGPRERRPTARRAVYCRRVEWPRTGTSPVASGRRAMPVTKKRRTATDHMGRGKPFMMQDLAALAPPAIVCAAFLVGAWVILRRELGPKRRARAEAAAAADKRAAEPAEQEQGRS